MISYEDFLVHKRLVSPTAGLQIIPELNPMLFNFQRDIVKWALQRGRAAIWADCGLGKGPMALEWAKHVPGEVLIVAPLAVSQQFKREAEKFGVKVGLAKQENEISAGITVTNYERINNFDAGRFHGVVLDESSILKAYDGKTRTQLIEMFRETPFRLCCTATPAPNDHMELANHAEFLGVMTRAEMLSMFFVHDGGETQKWRLKGHAQHDFWKWICSWAVMLRKPSDLGYDDADFVLPPLQIHEHKVESNAPTEGFLIPLEASSLQERIAARRSTFAQRVLKAVEIALSHNRQVICWCNLNSESTELARCIPDAIEITGSDSSEKKEQALINFIDGKVRVLVTKSTIAGYGMNLQCCADQIFVGLSDSWEQYYQAVRRCWRFGQQKKVNVHIVTAKIEGNVVANIKRKETDAAILASGMLKHMQHINTAAVHGATERAVTAYNPKTRLELPSWL